MGKKILITAGGTGGHIYPAQGLAQQIKKNSMEHEILFVAGGLNSNKFFQKEHFNFQEVPCSALISKNPLKFIKGLYNLIRGVYCSYKIIKKYKPDTVVGFGSFYTVSTLLAAKLAKIPIILHEANSLPGKANKIFSKYVHCVGVHFPSTIKLLQGRVIEVGMPLREDFYNKDISLETARNYFNLDATIPTLLIFGGSQGAQFINKIVKGCFQIPFGKKLQIIHLTGNEKNVEELQRFYKHQSIRACVKAFEFQMNMAWIAANFFIGRAGASAIAEAIEFEVPGILIPFPFATDNHQEINANFFVNDVNGALKYLEKDLTPNELNKILSELLLNDKIKMMKEAIKRFKATSQRQNLCDIVLSQL